MQGKWEPQINKYTSGDNYRIGKVVVGSVGYSATAAKDDPLKYVAAVALPGITLKRGSTHFATAEEAKARVESAVATWFRWLEAETVAG